MSKDTFIDRALSGEALLLEIDDYIDQWHENVNDVPLHEHLGLTRAEYALWLSEPEMLPHIIRARREYITIEKLVEQVVNDNQASDAVRIAARTNDTMHIDRLKRWLHSEGIDLH